MVSDATDESPITREEMAELFGSEMPIEAVELLWNSPDGWTIGQVRAELRKMAQAALAQGNGAVGVKAKWCGDGKILPDGETVEILAVDPLDPNVPARRACWVRWWPKQRDFPRYRSCDLSELDISDEDFDRLTSPSPAQAGAGPVDVKGDAGQTRDLLEAGLLRGDEPCECGECTVEECDDCMMPDVAEEQPEPVEKRGNFEAVSERTENDNFHTSIYESDYKGLLIARCNQNGKYPWQARAILAGLNSKKEALDALASPPADRGAEWEPSALLEAIISKVMHDHVSPEHNKRIGEGGCPRINWYGLRNELVDALRAAAPYMVPEGYRLIPDSALKWLFGEGPDHTGKWFGDAAEDLNGRFWWRSRFRAMIATSPSPEDRACRA